MRIASTGKGRIGWALRVVLSWTMLIAGANATLAQSITVLNDVNVIDGTGRAPLYLRDVTVKGRLIESIHPTSAASVKDATVLHLEGKTIIPELINTHGHLGLLRGTSTASANYT